MMKFVFLVISFFTFLNVKAQKNDVDGLVKKMAVEVCDEFTTKFSDKKISPSEMENALMSALLPVLLKHQSALTEMNIEMSDPKAMQKIGESLGIELMLSCPIFRNSLSGISTEGSSDEINIPGVAPVDEPRTQGGTMTIRGKLVKVVNDEINSFEIFGNDGKVHTFWVLREIQGSQLLNNPDKSNKEFEIEYREQIVFDLKTQSSKKVKIAVSVL